MQVDPDHVGHQHMQGMPEHGDLGLDPADPPPDHAQTVDHGGVRIGADQGIGKEEAIALAERPCQVLEIDLMHDADPGRDHGDRAEGLHAPFDEAVTFGVAREFPAHVPGQRLGRAVFIDLHRMVDHQFDRDQRFHRARVAASAAGRGAHRGEVAEHRHAGEILEQDARDMEWDLLGPRCLCLPSCKSTHVAGGDAFAVGMAQHRFQHHAQADRQARDFRETGGFQRRQGVDASAAAGTEFHLLDGGGKACERRAHAAPLFASASICQVASRAATLIASLTVG